MQLTQEQRLRRLQARLRELRFWLDREVVALPNWRFNGSALGIGEAWPTREGVVHLIHPEVQLPVHWPLEESRLELNLGGEGLVHIEYGAGDAEAWGLDPEHRRLPLRARQFWLSAEAVARLPFGVPNRAAALECARLVWQDMALERLIRRLQLVVEAAGVLSDREVAVPLLVAGERAIAALEWPSDTIGYLSRTVAGSQMQNIWSLPDGLESHPPGLSDASRQVVSAVADRLAADLSALQERYPRQGAIALTGHAHLDLAWLWPLEETRRKARRTYSTVLGLMERYPELRFNQSSAQLYAFIEEDDPALFARIQERVATGQWEPVGGMWVEPDINMPCGESLVRQLLYGQRYFQQRFGALHTVCWLPDCFGFSPALPQLLCGAGIENFFTIKVTWSDTNRFPLDLFWWEGLDGSRVLAHVFDNPSDINTNTSGYNADPGPHGTVHTWRNYKGKQVNGESLLSIGFGDGGGGVTAEMVERAREMTGLPAVPEVSFGAVAAFFERTRQAVQGQELPTWLGEMYLELHRGTLTTQGRTKYLHRRAERDLVAAETISALAYLQGGPEPASLEPLWRVLLRNQFHDILPGSSVREVYEQAEQELGGVVEAAGAIIEQQSGWLGEHIEQQSGWLGEHIEQQGGWREEHRVESRSEPALLLVNPDLSGRPLRVELNHTFPGAQPVEDGSVLATASELDGLSTHITRRTDPLPGLSGAPDRLENMLVRVSVAADGTIASLYHKFSEREALADPGNQLWAYVDKPLNWDAWDIDAGYARTGRQLRASSVEVVESGPHRAAIRAVYRFRDSTVTQDIRLWANSARLEFKTTADWHDRRWLLKARFPLKVRSERATFETAFGVIERSTHRNTSWEAARFEVAGHRFADLSEPGFGVALLNDGKYGHDAQGNELGLSLLRSPIHPDPLADEGLQTFTYALLPHSGDWLQGGVLMEAEDLNQPLAARQIIAARENSWQPLRITGLPVGLGALKVAEDGGDLILRVYEPRGARGPVEVGVPRGWKLTAETDLLERDTGAPDLYFTPFQVHSWRLKRDV